MRQLTVQIVEALGDAVVRDEAGKFVYNLKAGVTYLLHDHEAGKGLRDRALKIIHGLDRVLPVYARQSLGRERLLLPFIGKLGDAIVSASCVHALIQRHAGAVVDVACMASVREVFELMPVFGETLDYPVTEELLSRYDYYLSFEGVEAVPNGPRRSCADVFSTILRTPRPVTPSPVSLPASVRARLRLPPATRPRVGVHVGRRHNPRSLPEDVCGRLVKCLESDGFEVHLLGGDDAADGFPVSSGMHDLRGRTPTPADLAAVLIQMQAVITGDSFPLHLAGALGVPTIAAFTATDAIIGSDYPAVVAIQSDAECSPCLVAQGACPLGHRECIAHHEVNLSPERIAAMVHEAIGVAEAACMERAGTFAS